MIRCPKCSATLDSHRCSCGVEVSVRSLGDVARQITTRGKSRVAGRVFQGGELRKRKV